MVVPERPQMKICVIWRMRIKCWITKATDTHSEYVILIAFPWQQWYANELNVVSRYISCLVSRWPLTVEGRLLSQGSPREICGGKVALGHVILRTLPLSRINGIFPVLQSHISFISYGRYVQLITDKVAECDTSPCCRADQNFLSTGRDSRFVQRYVSLQTDNDPIFAITSSEPKSPCIYLVVFCIIIFYILLPILGLSTEGVSRKSLILAKKVP